MVLKSHQRAIEFITFGANLYCKVLSS